MTREGKILQVMLDKRGVIMMMGAGQDAYAIVPRGDRRCRPVGWVHSDNLTRLLAQGCIIKKAENYFLDPGYAHRAKTAKAHGVNDAYANQHRQLEAREIYHPDGIKRPARINNHLSTLTRLASRMDKNGQTFLAQDEIEAAKRFASDYARSMMAAVNTQNFGGAAGRERRATNTAEHISISALDARKHVMDALEAVGPGLDKALTALCGSDISMENL